jgi:hypothetical protein
MSTEADQKLFKKLVMGYHSAMFKKIQFHINSNRLTLIAALAVFLLSLVLIPKYLFVGGDDSKLYYLFPLEFLKNYGLSIISDTSPGSMGAYISHAYFALPTLYYWILKNALNALGLLSLLFPVVFALHLSVGFASFSKLLSLFVDDDGHGPVIKILGSLLYSFSALWIYSIWGHLLLEPLYCFSLFPLLVYFFLKGLREDSLRPAVYIVLLLTFFPPLAVPSPWMLGLILSFAPALLYLCFDNKIRFLKNAAFVVGMTLICNLYWIGPIVYAPQLEKNDNIISRVTTPEALEAGAMVVKSVASTNQLTYTALMIPQRSFVENFSSHYIEFYKSYYLAFYLLNFVFFILILAALAKSQDRPWFRVFVLSWVLTTFLFTVKIDGWGLDFFILLVKRVPLFGTFKNHFDKFAPAMIFLFSLVFACSLNFVLKTIKGAHLQKLALAFFAFLILVNIAPQISWQQHRILKNQPDSFHSKITGFNADFLSLNEAVRQLPKPGRLLTLPLNLANYFAIADSEDSGLYSLSLPPFPITAGVQTISGFMLPQKNGDQLYKALLAKDYEAAVEIFKKLSIRHIVVSTETYEKRINDMLYAGSELHDLQLQPEFLEKILGKKISQFGERYSLYEIKDNLLQSPITVVNENTGKVQNLVTSEFDGACYQAEIPADAFRPGNTLHLSEPPSTGWVARLSSGETTQRLAVLASQEGLSNRWSLSELQGRSSSHLEACFTPAKLTPWLTAVSFAGFSLLILSYLFVRAKGIALDFQSINHRPLMVAMCLMMLLFIPALAPEKIAVVAGVFALAWWRAKWAFALVGLIYIVGMSFQAKGNAVYATYMIELAYYCIPVLLLRESLRYLKKNTALT